MFLRGSSQPDVYARSTWEGRNLTQLTQLWERHVASSSLATACPKVGIGFFYYPSLGATIRGAKATAPIKKGERLCNVPVRELLSEYTVGNSSMQPVMQWAFNQADRPTATSGAARAAASATRRRRAVDDRTRIVLFALRELARERSPKMPYLQLIQSHDVSGVPMLWAEGSARYQSLSPMAREMASRSRTYARAQYDALVPAAIERFPALLSEGLGCPAASCPRARLEAVYGWARFARLFAIVSARDWVLPVDGENRAFLAPVLDLLNFGQVGIRAEFNVAAKGFVATATAPIAQGSELLFYYGTMCKEAWINLYGFAPAEARPCRNANRAAGGSSMSARVRANKSVG